MSDFEMRHLLTSLKALANETRLKMIGLLIDHERSVGEIAELLNLKEPTISHHLAILSQAEIVTLRVEGNSHFYRLRSDTLQQINRELITPERVTRLVQTEIAASDQKILSTFLDGERLRKIPESLKKRMVILKWLANQFEHGINYSEAEVNVIIKRHHPDTASLRRELIQFKFMQRSKGVYWRISEEKRRALMTEVQGSQDALA